MLFHNEKADIMRGNLTALMGSVIYAMRLLESRQSMGKRGIEAAHKALYEAMLQIVDEKIALDYEYHFLLDQANRRLKIHHLSG
jgi:hypothetical protein